ncbi:MAG: YeeE/YedE thiosulfate transporter family protein [Pseudomonadota bacterium]
MIETVFTPWASLAGGVLIGIAATLLMLTSGRILGATGLLAGLFPPASGPDMAWRVPLLAGMVTGPAFVWLTRGEMPAIEIPGSTLALIVGGLLVGVGVTFGSGCTSGHGVCGMARLSPRSAAATVTFMTFTGLTVYVIRHVIGG